MMKTRLQIYYFSLHDMMDKYILSLWLSSKVTFISQGNGAPTGIHPGLLYKMGKL
jgi:hypothetical protein